MQTASNITVTRGTAHGSETVAYVEAGSAGDDRITAARVIVDMLSALELEGIRHGWAVEYAKIRAELLIDDWGFERLPAAKAVLS